jgi:hypothetical protein
VHGSTQGQAAEEQVVHGAQGVWNETDGFVFTDPVIHHISKQGRRHRNGVTDKGAGGVQKFFATHQCNSVCRRLGLTMPSKNQLRMP